MIYFTVKYYGQREGEERKFSHSYDEGWEKTAYFCPCCGKHEVWHETGGGDYYVGEQHLCADCGASFELPGGADPRPRSEQDPQRLEAIRAARDAAGESK